MQKDHTYEVEKRVEAIHIKRLDCCSFYLPKENVNITVKMCASCCFGFFAGDEKNGFCKYRPNSKEQINKSNK